MAKYSGIKRIDEAQELLMREHKENGLKFLLITKSDNDETTGVCLQGNITHLSATCAVYGTKHKGIMALIKQTKEMSEYLSKYDLNIEEKTPPE